VEKNSHDEINDVKITQVNPRTELSDLEKTAILQFELDKKEEELSKTQRFKILNSRKRKKRNIDLPIIKEENLELPKKKASLTDTIKIKLSDLSAAILEDEKKNTKRSLYDTVILKLDDLINRNDSLSKKSSKKVTSVENAIVDKKFHLFKPRDITKCHNIKINIDSEEFGRQLYNLNKIALNNLSSIRPKCVRKYSSIAKLETMEKIHISDENFDKYQKKLNRFAVDKLYYKLAPKETKKYKLYKYSVFVSGCVFVATSIIILNWFIQGISINQISHSLNESTPIVEVTEGEIVDNTLNDEVLTQGDTEQESSDDSSNKTTLYWKYLNTPLSSVDFTELVKENSDTVGWLIVNNTNVNYPVVQTNDNDYYLTHDFNKNSNSAGWVYADFRDNFSGDFNDLSQNTVIYAHGRKDKVMFGSLTNTLKSSWYTNGDNQIIQLSTLKYNTMWQIFAIYKIEAESYYITTDFSSKESYAVFIETMKNRSIYDFGVDVTTDDKLLTLSTCYNDNGIRLVVQAKLVKIQSR